MEAITAENTQIEEQQEAKEESANPTFEFNGVTLEYDETVASSSAFSRAWAIQLSKKLDDETKLSALADLYILVDDMFFNKTDEYLDSVFGSKYVSDEDYFEFIAAAVNSAKAKN